jgi:ribokinase
LKKILVIGSSNMDYVIKMPRMPVIGETVMGESIEKLPGGKGANQAYACGRLGGDAIFLSAVGDDELGRNIIANMDAVGVDASKIRIMKDAPTGTAFIYVNAQGNNSIVVIAGANAGCDREYIQSQSALIHGSDIILAQMEIPSDGVYYAMSEARRLGKITVLNPAPAPDSIPDNIYRCLDFITPNETELHKLTGCPVDTMEDVEKACCVLLKKGVKNVLVTLGAKGAMFVSPGAAQLFEPPEIKAVDATAAGDTFSAAFAVELAGGSGCCEAIRFANLASAITVSRMGAQASIPSRKEVDIFKASMSKQYN